MNRKFILVRFDDICPTMDYVQFNRALDVLRKKNIKPLLGVIPDNHDPDLFIDKQNDEFWDWLQKMQNDGYTIAMHGFQHVFTKEKRGIVTKRAVSEFSGHTLDEQIKKIREGKRILISHGIETDVFFAPAHSYDENTLKALSINGFHYMSDGKSSLPYIWHGIKCLPARSSGCPSITRNGLYTAVFHAHEWVRKDKQADYDALVKLVENNFEDIVSFDVYKSVDNGLFWIERIKEILYVFMERHFLKAAVCLKHLLKL